MSRYTTRISKTIDVTITLGADERVIFNFKEPESGDDYMICTSLKHLTDEEDRVGSELLSWLSLMQEELDDVLKEENEQ